MAKRQWEYKLIAERDVGDLEAELNRLGEDGWELVAFVGYQSLDSMVLKRRKKRPKEPAHDGDSEPPEILS